MTILDWIPALSTAAILSGIGWLARELIATRLSAAVKHEFNEKLERQRVAHDQSLEVLKADLRRKEEQITNLSSGALSRMTSRQVTLDKRLLEAVDQLYSGLQSLLSGRAGAQIIGHVKFEAASKASASDERTREFFATLGGAVDIEKLKRGDAGLSRPYVSELAWALFSAYEAIVTVSAMKLKALEAGIGIPTLIDDEAVTKVIIAVLPHQEAFIRKFGFGACHHLLDELEARLLAELKNLLKGEEGDEQSVAQAAQIMEAVEAISKPNEEGKG